MTNDWKAMWRVEAVLGQLEVTLNVALNHTLTADDKGLLRRLILNEPDCTAQRIYGAISMLVPGEPSGEDISNAINKVVRILDGQLFRSACWWEVITAFKQFDALSSTNQVN
jgi:hypothetical protein